MTILNHFPIRSSQWRSVCSLHLWESLLTLGVAESSIQLSCPAPIGRKDNVGSTGRCCKKCLKISPITGITGLSRLSTTDLVHMDYKRCASMVYPDVWKVDPLRMCIPFTWNCTGNVDPPGSLALKRGNSRNSCIELPIVANKVFIQNVFLYR